MTYTPMIMQYLDIKKDYQDTILFYRLGDFYEMFFEDAIIASKELELVLTGRNAGVEDKIPMCGVPHHAANNYINRLVEKGYKVAIVEQLTEAKAGKMVERDICKIITPGTIFNDDSDNTINICGIHDYKYGYALAIIDLSTGNSIALNINHNTIDLKAVINKYSIKEIVCNNDLELVLDTVISKATNEKLAIEYLDLTKDINDPRIIEAYTLVINYLNKTQKVKLTHLQDLVLINPDDYLKLDYNCLVNLELVKVSNNEQSFTLYDFLNKCQSSMGSRLLKEKIIKPLINLELINERLDQVTILKNNLILQDDLKNYLNKIYDIERIVAKISLKTFSPNDALRLIKTLEVVPLIKEVLSNNIEFSDLIEFDDLDSLYLHLKSAIKEDTNMNIKDGGVFKEGYNLELDELLALSNDSKDWILNQEQIEKDKTGIKNLKIGYNKVFGYYIEVTKANIGLIKDEYGYIRKQTLTNQERYITNELKEKENLILNSFDKAIRKEIALFEELLDLLSSYLNKLQIMAHKLASIDVLYAFSVISNYNGYTRPNFNSDELIIEKGRHPLLEHVMKTKYVSNDCIMHKNEDVILLTGPNMGGKSTYMRQVALIVVMAQMGLYVPCSKLELPIFDAIYTRIGANDDILSGQSTFMVEMNEANYAISNATKNSLLIFDELGRGTSTYDGLSIARSIVEYIANNIKCKTLFSTHYHELTTLEKELTNIINYQVIVHEENDHITFMYQVKKGKANKSYGINVASLAHLPDQILNRARFLLDNYENKKITVMEPLFSYNNKPIKEDLNKIVIDKLKLIDVNSMTPLEAILFINEIKKEVK